MTTGVLPDRLNTISCRRLPDGRLISLAEEWRMSHMTYQDLIDILDRLKKEQPDVLGSEVVLSHDGGMWSLDIVQSLSDGVVTFVFSEVD